MGERPRVLACTACVHAAPCARAAALAARCACVLEVPLLHVLEVSRHAYSKQAHLGRLLQPVPGLPHGDVEHQLGHADVPHGVGGLVPLRCEGVRGRGRVRGPSTRAQPAGRAVLHAGSMLPCWVLAAHEEAAHRHGVQPGPVLGFSGKG